MWRAYEEYDESKGNIGTFLNYRNRDRARNDFLVDMRGIELPDDTFWHDVRTRLSDNQWKWVNHYVIHGLSIKEITQLEDVSEVAVKSWARETRRKLRNEEVRERFVEIFGA